MQDALIWEMQNDIALKFGSRGILADCNSLSRNCCPTLWPIVPAELDDIKTANKMKNERLKLKM